MDKLPPKTKQQDQFHRPATLGLYLDQPVIEEDPLYLFTLPYMQLIGVLADVLFPPRKCVREKGDEVIRASDARVDRYVLFRSAWQPDFGMQVQLALLDLTEFCIRQETSHFATLSLERQTEILEGLETGELRNWTGVGNRSATRCFEVIYGAVIEGFFGEPGYGGNDHGLGWHYSNFIPR